MNRYFLLLGSLSFILILEGCSPRGIDNQILADVGGKKITEADFFLSLAPQAKQSYSQFKKEQLERLVAQKLFELEAKKRKMPVEKLLAEEVTSKATVSEEEILKVYEKNKKKFVGKKKDVWKKEIENAIRQQKISSLASQLLAGISTKKKVYYYLPSVTKGTVR